MEVVHFHGFGEAGTFPGGFVHLAAGCLLPFLPSPLGHFLLSTNERQAQYGVNPAPCLSSC